METIVLKVDKRRSELLWRICFNVDAFLDAGLKFNVVGNKVSVTYKYDQLSVERQQQLIDYYVAKSLRLRKIKYKITTC